MKVDLNQEELVEAVSQFEWDWNVAWSSFLGAACSFLFLLIYDRMVRARERKGKAINSIVEIEFITNEIVAITSENAYILRGALRRADHNHERGEFAVSVLGLRALPRIPNESMSSLLSSDLANMAFCLNVDVGTVNSDSKKFEELYAKTVASINGQLLDPVQLRAFQHHYDQASKAMRDQELGFLGLMDQAIELHANLRVVYRKAVPWWSLTKRLRTPKLKKWKVEIEAEIEKLESEILAMRKKPTVLERAGNSNLDFLRGSD